MPYIALDDIMPEGRRVITEYACDRAIAVLIAIIIMVQ